MAAAGQPPVVVGIFRKRRLFTPDAHGQQNRVERREQECGEPGRVHQGDGDPLENHGEIVRVPKKPIRTSGDRRFARDHDDPHVPAATERQDRRVAQRLRRENDREHREAESGHERSAESPDFEGFLTNFVPEEKRSADVVAFLEGRGRAALGLLDNHLAGRNWIVGEAMTIADLSCAGYMFFVDEFPIDWAADYPNLTAWRERIRAVQGWQHPYDLMPGRN